MFNPMDYVKQGVGIAGDRLQNQATSINNASLAQLNQARIEYLNQINQGQSLINQKNNLLMDYVVPEEKANIAQTQANTGLIGANTGLAQANTNQTYARTNLLPATTLGGLMTAFAKLGINLNPGAAYRNLPAPVADAMAAANIQGQSNIGALSNYNLNAAPMVDGLINKFMPGLMGSNSASTMGNASAQPPPSTAMGMAAANAQPQGASPLPLDNRQINNLANLFGQNNGGRLSPPPAYLGNNNAQQASPPGMPAGAPAANPAASQQVQDVVSQLQARGANSAAAPSLMQKYNYANNLLTTLSKYGNPAVTFAKYMGPAGFAKYPADLAKQNPEAIKFQSFLNKIKPLAGDQLRQFFGASVQPSAMAEFDTILNPQSLTSSPAAAAKSYDDLMDILRQEGGQAALTVGKQKVFNDKFGAPTAENYLNNINTLKQAGASGKTYFQTLPDNVQAEVLALHKRRPKSNG